LPLQAGERDHPPEPRPVPAQHPQQLDLVPDAASRWLYPVGSGQRLPLDAIARDLQDRLISPFLAGPDGRRPCFGTTARLQHDPEWKDNLVFGEYALRQTQP
jgi:hypothetical protein